MQYVLAGGDYRKHGYKYHGSMLVLATMLRYEYLWTRIRVQGGAYGANAVFDRNGVMYFSTYRDPQLKSSLETFRALPDWLDRLELTDREIPERVPTALTQPYLIRILRKPMRPRGHTDSMELPVVHQKR